MISPLGTRSMCFIVYFNIPLFLTSNLLPLPHHWSHSHMVSGVCTAWSAINICKRVKKQQFWLTGQKITSKTTKSAWAHASSHWEFAIVEEDWSSGLSLYASIRGPRNTGTTVMQMFTPKHSCMMSKQWTGMLTYVRLGWGRTSFIWPFSPGPNQGPPSSRRAALPDSRFLEWINPV